MRYLALMLPLALACTNGESPDKDTDTDTDPGGTVDSDTTETDTDTDASGDPDVPASAPCHPFFPADQVGILWTYETEGEAGTFEWEQEVLPRTEEGFQMVTRIEGATTTSTYACTTEGVALLSTETVAGQTAASMTLAPPYAVWPAGMVAASQTWTATSTASVAVTSPIPFTTTQDWSGSWEVTAVEESYTTEDGATWADVVVHTVVQDVDGTTTGQTHTEETIVMSYDGPGMVWNHVVTTTTVPGSGPLVAETTTRLLSVDLNE